MFLDSRSILCILVNIVHMFLSLNSLIKQKYYHKRLKITDQLFYVLMVITSKHISCTPLDCIMCTASNLTSINTLESCVYKQQFSLTGESVLPM